MNRSDLTELVVAMGLQRPLTDAQRARAEVWLQAHPEDREWIEAEMGLNQALRSIPQALPSSNFTARVLEAVRHSQRGRGRGWLDRVHLPIPRWAWGTTLAGAALVLGLAGYRHHQAVVRLERAESVVTISESLPNIELLRDFTAIKELRPVQVEPEVDTLVAALQ